MADLYLKPMQSYMRCQQAIAAYNGWHLEIKSSKLPPLWKMHRKTTYMRLQYKYMERCYDDVQLPRVYCEIMLANSFFVKASSRAVAFDE